VSTQGRLADPTEFGNIVVKTTSDANVFLRDVARIELAAQDYGTISYLTKNEAVALAIFPAARLECA
jgi:multidrug efflux pump subunit AcrB